MDFNTACDLLGLNAETVVRDHANNIDVNPRDDQPFIGWYIEHRMASMGYNTKQDAADAMGVSRTFYYGLITGTKRLSDDMVDNMADTLGFTKAELLTARSVDVLTRGSE